MKRKSLIGEGVKNSKPRRKIKNENLSSCSTEYEDEVLKEELKPVKGCNKI